MGTRSHFVPSAPVRVEHPDYPGEWVDIKPKLSVGDRNALYTAMMSIEDNKSEIAVGGYLQALLESAIVDWHLLDADGAPIPFDKALITKFDVDDPLIEKVQDEVAKRNPFGKKTPIGSAA
jgi:hypothetical protein